MNAAVIGDTNLQMNVALPSYAAHWNLDLSLNESFMAEVDRRAHECDLTSYMDEHLRFPPSTKLFRQLTWQNDTWAAEQCGMADYLKAAAELVNPCFNVYHITDSCPRLK
jgi:carboxypeptidase D